MGGVWEAVRAPGVPRRQASPETASTRAGACREGRLEGQGGADVLRQQRSGDRGWPERSWVRVRRAGKNQEFCFGFVGFELLIGNPGDDIGRAGGRTVRSSGREESPRH